MALQVVQLLNCNIHWKALVAVLIAKHAMMKIQYTIITIKDCNNSSFFIEMVFKTRCFFPEGDLITCSKLSATMIYIAWSVLFTLCLKYRHCCHLWLKLISFIHNALCFNVYGDLNFYFKVQLKVTSTGQCSDLYLRVLDLQGLGNIIRQLFLLLIKHFWSFLSILIYFFQLIWKITSATR